VGLFLIENGMVVDGMGAPSRATAVLVEGETIKEVAPRLRHESGVGGAVSVRAADGYPGALRV